MMRYVQQVRLLGLMGLLVAGCAVQESVTEDQGVNATEQAVTSDGPFIDVQALINYWTVTSTSGAATQIFLNGSKVYERAGFSPPFLAEYFSCTETIHHAIYSTCPTGNHDGFTDFNTLVSRYPAGTAISRDGVLIRSGTGAGSVNIATCTGDLSLAGCARYFKVILDSNPFIGVPYISGCYSHNSSGSCP